MPASVSCALEGPDRGYPISAWQGAGVTRVDGAALAATGDHSHHLLMPAGRQGPAFIVSGNFYVLKAYNESDLYALFIGHLADRLSGDARIRGQWRAAGGMTRGDVRRLQERLVAQGYEVGGVDGLVGFRTRTAIGMWQTQGGGEPTCYPDADLVRQAG